MKRSFCFLLISFFIYAGYGQGQEENMNVFDLTLEQLLNIKIEEKRFQLYGYINSNVEKVFAFPAYDSIGNFSQTDQPLNWTPVRNFHIYGSQMLSPRINVFFNLAYNNEEALEIRNAYGDFKVNNLLFFRIGKIYRRFGLYNEKLDQIPTFIGIEPPEIFDKDHLFITRTTAFMLHGQAKALHGNLIYALTFDNGEGGPHKKSVPLGWDFRYRSEEYRLILGTSGYTSGGVAKSTVELGQGSPDGAVLPWMEEDRFQVYSFYVEKTFNKILLQASYTISPHKALRNRDKVLTLFNEAQLTPEQKQRFTKDGSQLNEPVKEDIISEINYISSSAYFRFGYAVSTKAGRFIPYLLLDYMQNPETIQNVKYGGDNEAGLSDNGAFFKPSLGVSYRPQPEVAIKLDASMHSQVIKEQRVFYPEIRLDFSFSFDAINTITKREF